MDTQKKRPQGKGLKRLIWPLYTACLLFGNLAIALTGFLYLNPAIIGTVGLYVNFGFSLLAAGLLVIQKWMQQRELAVDIIDIPNQQYTDRWLIKHIPHMLCVKDKDGHWLAASSSYLKMLNLDPDNYRGKTDTELSRLSPQFKSMLVSTYDHDDDAWEKREPVARMTEFLVKQETLTIKITKIPIFDQQGERFKLITTGSDITPGEQKQNALKLAASVFQQSIKCLLIIDLQFRIMHINSAMSRLIGYNYSHVKGKSLAFLNEQDITADLFKTIQKQIQEQEFWEDELFCIRRNSALFPAKINIAPVLSRTRGTVKHYIGIVTDQSEHKANEQNMIRLAHYDSLTGLPNRVMFLERLNKVLQLDADGASKVMLLFIDLDKFKDINDTMGHSAGDALLKAVADRLMQSVRKNDLVARISGDEFGVLLENNGSYDQACESASVVAHKINKVLTDVFEVQRKQVFIGASIGIAVYPDDANNSQNLLKYADIAMYSAKQHGRNNYQFFKQEHISELQLRNQLETDIRVAMDRQEFKLFYQPQFDLVEKKLVGVEALVRWHKQHKTWLAPSKFLTIAEQSGLIIPLGAWILDSACQQQKAWMAAGCAPPRVSVNIAGRQFGEQDFIKSIETTLANNELGPDYLQLEITESMLMGEMDRIIEKLQCLKDMGVSIAIDDFGTGYSSLAYLKDFPIDCLKIDRSFVMNLPANTKEENMVRAIIEMGHSLGLTVVAEGVETQAQFDFLKASHCDISQGYLLGEPVDAERMTQLLQ